MFFDFFSQGFLSKIIKVYKTCMTQAKITLTVCPKRRSLNNESLIQPIKNWKQSGDCDGLLRTKLDNSKFFDLFSIVIEWLTHKAEHS